MLTNSSMMLSRWEGTEEAPIRKDYIFEKVFWHEKTVSTTSRTGTNESREVNVFIPLDSLPKGLPLDFEFLNTDLVIKGFLKFADEKDPMFPGRESTPKIQSDYVKTLNKRCGRTYRIKECSKQVYGSARMQHYELVLV